MVAARLADCSQMACLGRGPRLAVRLTITHVHGRAVTKNLDAAMQRLLGHLGRHPSLIPLFQSCHNYAAHVGRPHCHWAGTLKSTIISTDLWRSRSWSFALRTDKTFQAHLKRW